VLNNFTEFIICLGLVKLIAYLKKNVYGHFQSLLSVVCANIVKQVVCNGWVSVCPISRQWRAAGLLLRAEDIDG